LKWEFRATAGTANYFLERGRPLRAIEKDQALSLIKNHHVDFVINIPKNLSRTELETGYLIRSAAIQYGCVVLTNAKKTDLLIKAVLDRFETDDLVISRLPSHLC
jgi:carbamoyl-phosphate synthase large subunit